MYVKTNGDTEVTRNVLVSVKVQKCSLFFSGKMSRENTVGRLTVRQGLTVCVLFHLELISAQTLIGEWCEKWGEGSGKECVRLLTGESKRVKESLPSQGC